MNNNVDIDTDVAQSIPEGDFGILKVDFSPEWLSYTFMEQVFEELGKAEEEWKNAVRVIKAYATEAVDTGNAEQPQIIEESLSGEDETIQTPNIGLSSSSGSSRPSSSSRPSTPSSGNSDIPKPNISIKEFIFGTVLLTKGMLLFENIGGTSITINNDTNYDLLGIEKYNDKYYYLIFDKNTNKQYYVEIGSNIELTSNYNMILETTDKTMILTSTTIGEKNLKAIADVGNCYFVKGEIEKDGLEFVNIIGSDGIDYYIPKGDSINLKTIESLKG